MRRGKARRGRSRWPIPYGHKPYPAAGDVKSGSAIPRGRWLACRFRARLPGAPRHNPARHSRHRHSPIRPKAPPGSLPGGAGPFKTQGELERARGPLELQSNPAACTPDSRQFLRRGACPPEKKLLPCSFRARKCEAFQRKLVGVAVAGELAPPSTSLFDKQGANAQRRDSLQSRLLH